MRPYALVRTAIAAIAALGAACGVEEPKVGKARLADASGVVSVPPGPTIELPGGTAPAGVKGPVKIAADRDVPFGEVMRVAEEVRKAGGSPAFLVAAGTNIRALKPLAPTTKDDSIRLVAYTDGRACISPPGVVEAVCVQRLDRKHIDRSHVRELVRKAVKEYNLVKVAAVIDPALGWADAVRAIDGARTCCGDMTIDVSADSM